MLSADFFCLTEITNFENILVTLLGIEEYYKKSHVQRLSKLLNLTASSE